MSGSILKWCLLLGVTGYLVFLNVQIFFPAPAPVTFFEEDEAAVPDDLPVPTRDRWIQALCGVIVPASPGSAHPFTILAEVAEPVVEHGEAPLDEEPPGETGEGSSMLSLLKALLGGNREAPAGEASPVKAAAEETLPVVQIRLILVARGVRLAVTDGALLHEGDEIGGHRIVRIEPRGIWIDSARGEVLLSLDTEDASSPDDDLPATRPDHGDS